MEHVRRGDLAYSLHQSGLAGGFCNLAGEGCVQCGEIAERHKLTWTWIAQESEARNRAGICGAQWNLIRSGILRAERKERFYHG